MADFPDHFSGHASAYAAHRPRYPEALFDALVAEAPGATLAWDVATGNGQAARALAERVAQVVATDASAAQVAAAAPHPRVAFRVEPAEATSLADASVDLITVAQALHWFDVPRFASEVQRVARPGAVLAAWCYELLDVDPAVNHAIREVYDSPLAPFWPPQRRHIEAGYATLTLPGAPIALPTFTMRHRWTREALIAYLGTWSSVVRYQDALGLDPLAPLTHSLRTIWPDDEVREVRFPLTLRATRLGGRA